MEWDLGTYQPFAEAPPASAIAAIPLRVTNSRKSRYFMSTSPLRSAQVSRSSSSRSPRFVRSTKTDQTLGRSVALLAQLHPKCPFQVEASARPSVLKLISGSTEVLAAGGTIGSRKCTGQYACVPIGTWPNDPALAAARHPIPSPTASSARIARLPPRAPQRADRSARVPAGGLPNLARPHFPAPR